MRLRLIVCSPVWHFASATGKLMHEAETMLVGPALVGIN